MANKKTTKRKRGKRKQKKVQPVVYRSEDYVKQIIKCLETVCLCSGERPFTVFDHFLEIADATLRELPEQVKSIARTGYPGPDSAETAATFEKIRTHYERSYSYNEQTHHKIWREGFCKAYDLLLKSTEDGLWQTNWSTVHGPDVLGAVYQSWSNSSPQWKGQYFTPWAIAVLSSQVICANIEQEIYTRLEEALRHPDNILGQAALMTSQVLSGVDEGSLHQDLFLRLLASSAPYFKKIKFYEPALGSGIMALSFAASCPEWAIKYNLCEFFGTDIDASCVLMSKINFRLYSLNGFGLQLAATAAEAKELYRERVKSSSLEQDPRMVYQEVPHSGNGKDKENGNAVYDLRNLHSIAAGTVVVPQTAEMV